MRVGIAEDDAVYRAGLMRFVTAAGVQVSHEAASGAELVAHLRRDDLPDVVIMDIRMPGNDLGGLQAADAIASTYPQVGVLLLSAYPEAAYANRLFANGAAGKGYMLKETLNAVSQLREALERISQNLTYCDPKIMDQLIAQRHTTGIRDLLTAREQQILQLLAAGASNEAIVASTHSTAGAVESALVRIYGKLQIPRGSEYTPRVLAALRWLSETDAS